MPLRQPQSGFDDIQCGGFLGQYGANAAYDDFGQGLTVSLSFQDVWDVNSAGGSAQFNAAVANHPGVLSLHTAATGCGISATMPSFALADGFWEMTWLVAVTELAGANTFTFRCGIATRQQIVDFTNGVYFEYDAGISPNWRGVCAAGGVRTKVTGNIPVTTAFHYLTVNGQGSNSANFFVDGVEAGIGVITTNLPTGANVVPANMLNQTAGAGDVIAQIDLSFYREAFSTNR